MSNAPFLTPFGASHGRGGPYGEFGAFRAHCERSIQFLLKPLRGKSLLQGVCTTLYGVTTWCSYVWQQQWWPCPDRRGDLVWFRAAAYSRKGSGTGGAQIQQEHAEEILDWQSKMTHVNLFHWKRPHYLNKFNIKPIQTLEQAQLSRQFTCSGT